MIIYKTKYLLISVFPFLLFPRSHLAHFRPVPPQGWLGQTPLVVKEVGCHCDPPQAEKQSLFLVLKKERSPRPSEWSRDDKGLSVIASFSRPAGTDSPGGERSWRENVSSYFRFKTFLHFIENCIFSHLCAADLYSEGEILNEEAYNPLLPNENLSHNLP